MGLLEAQVLSADTPIPDLLDGLGHLRLLRAQDYDAIPREQLRMFCHAHGRYGLPTVELVHWLREFIGKRRAIEIGAGHGDLAFHVGLHATDSWCQDFPDVKIYYEMMGQPRIQYPAWVEKLEAADAIKRHKPEVVVASWVTEWIPSDGPVPSSGGSVYGVHEDQILASGVTYVLIGNEAVHGAKKIMAWPCETYALPFLRSRASRPELDRVYVWNP